MCQGERSHPLSAAAVPNLGAESPRRELGHSNTAVPPSPEPVTQQGGTADPSYAEGWDGDTWEGWWGSVPCHLLLCGQGCPREQGTGVVANCECPSKALIEGGSAIKPHKQFRSVLAAGSETLMA